MLKSLRKTLWSAVVAGVAGTAAFADPILDSSLSFDQRHHACLEAIAGDAENAYESAATWVGRGGGFRARHCEAMALFALDHAGEAATRLDTLAAEFPKAGRDAELDRLRVNYFTEAAQAWLQAGELSRAWNSATQALDTDEGAAEARIVRARVYLALERVEDADVDLTSALAFNPDHAELLRYRADVRRRLGRLDAALADAEASLAIAPGVDTALIRGHIRQELNEELNTSETQP